MTTGITVSTHHRRRENGSAVVEFVFLSVVMLIPLLRPGDDSYPDDPDRRDGFDEYFRGDWD